MKNFLYVVLLICSALSCSDAVAHNASKAKSGGVLSTAGDLEFELVSSADDALIFVEDYSKPISTTGVSGKLTVLAGGKKTEGELKSGGENRIVVSGLKLESGAKVVAAVTLAGKKPLAVRFAVR